VYITNSDLDCKTLWDATKYPMVTRDFQRIKEYRSEWALRKVIDVPQISPTENSLFLKEIVRGLWFCTHFGEVSFAVRYSGRRTTGSACCSRNRATGTFTLKFGKSPDKFQAIHELAHLVTWGQKHGPIFCLVHLQMVTKFIGNKFAMELYRQFKINRVGL